MVSGCVKVIGNGAKILDEFKGRVQCIETKGVGKIVEGLLFGI